jgi:hypothetical protein
MRLRTLRGAVCVCACHAVNGGGRPCEGELHARLDGEGLETEQPPPRQPFTRQLRNVTDRAARRGGLNRSTTHLSAWLD